MREAVQTLEHLTRQEPDESDWKLLLRAYASMGNNEQTRKTVDRAILYYEKNLPASVRELGVAAMQRDERILIGKGNIKSRSALASTNIIASDGDTSLIDLAKILGIATSSQLKLEGSQLAPRQCIERTRHRLYFSGVLASKWVMEAGVRNAFDQLLTRLDTSQGDVRFLIINPHSQSFKRLHDLRKGNISTEALPHLKTLVKSHDCFEVRAFDSLPAFRIVIIDDDVVTFSPYRLPAESYQKSGNGWESPHVVLDPIAPYPLAEAFQILFLETWEKSLPIMKLR